MSKLVVSLKGRIIHQYFIDKPNITIGRDEANDVAINDPMLSRVHLSIIKMGKDAIAEDLQSSNGSLINGKPLARQILQHRDVIDIGSHQLRYMSAEIASDIDLDRTMLLQIPSRPVGTGGPPPVDVPRVGTSRAKLLGGEVDILAAPQPEDSGQTISLERVITTFGRPGDSLLVITRRPHGIFVSHVEGKKPPRINRKNIGTTPQQLKEGDMIEGAGYRLRFMPK